MTFKECFEKWWSIYQLNLNPVTISKHDLLYRTHILPSLGNKDLSEISDCDVVNFVNEQLEHGNCKTHTELNPNTVRRLVGVVSLTFDYAIDNGLADKNQCKGIKIKQIPPKEFEIFSESEIESLIQHTSSEWLSDMILLAYRTGMRKGELYGLQWGDIDFPNKCLEVKRTISSDSYRVIYTNQPKTRCSKRKVFLDEMSMLTLERRRKRNTMPGVEWVFPNKDGQPRCPNSHTALFRNACNAVNVPYRNFHCIRHSHITWLLNKGVPVKLVSERVGHSNALVTANTYAHYVPSTQATVVDVLNAQSQATEKPNTTIHRECLPDEISELHDKIAEAMDLIAKCNEQIKEYEERKKQSAVDRKTRIFDEMITFLSGKGLSLDDMKEMIANKN